MTKLYQRIRNNWLWLMALVVSLAFSIVWFEASFFSEDDQLVGPGTVENSLIKDLQISIIYPPTLSSDNRGGNSKPLIITTHNSARPPVDFVEIDFHAPVGIINFLDKDKNQIPGVIKLPVTRGNVPTTVWVEHANTSVASSRGEVLVETVVRVPGSSNTPDIRVPGLDLLIKIEPWWWQRVKNVARTAAGPIAPLSFVALLISFAVRRRRLARQLDIMYLEVQANKVAKRWDAAVFQCKEIIKIDPLYDDIGKEFQDVNAAAANQSKRLKDLFLRAYTAYRLKDWEEAKRLFDEIRVERDDYENTSELLAETIAKLKEAEKRHAFYETGVNKEVQGEIAEAIRCFQEVLKISPENQDAEYRAAEERLVRLLAKRIADEPRFVRSFLLKPSIDFQYMADSIDIEDRSVSDTLLSLTRDDNVTVRRNLAAMAGYMSSPIGRKVATRLLEDPDHDVRSKASSVLMVEEEISDLIKQLEEPDRWQEAASELIKRAESAVQPLILALGREYPIWKRAIEVLQAMGEVGLPALVDARTSSVQPIRDRIDQIIQGVTRNERNPDVAPTG